MAKVPNNHVTVINPKPAPHDSFVGPEFASIQSSTRRSDQKCKCTACGTEKDSRIDKLYAHPVLKVLICDACEKFYHIGEFTKDADGIDEQCRWCGQGGHLLICDSPNCSYSFCNYCIKRNFSSKIFANILAKDKWKCFCCDELQLRHHVEECKKFVNFNSIRPQSRHRKLKSMNVTTPDGLTKTNEQIDSILGPLERSYNGIDSEINSNHINKKVTPLTIFRKQDHYVIQQKSMSCDESDPKLQDQRTQSDPETPRKISKMNRLENKIGRIKVKIEKRSSNEEKPLKKNDEPIRGPNNAPPSTNADANGEVETRNETAGNITESSDPARKLTMSGGNSDNQNIVATAEPQPDLSNSNQNNLAATNLRPVRKNVGRRTKANRVGSGYEKEDPTGKHDHDSVESNANKSMYSNPKLEKAGVLINQYFNLIKDLISEDCSLSTSNNTSIHPHSQYSRFRATNAVLQHVKHASKQLSAMESNLQKTKIQLATYRHVMPSPKSVVRGDESNHLDWNNKVRNLREKFDELSNSSQTSSESSEIYEMNIAEDAKLLVEPQVIVKKLQEEVFDRLITLCGYPRYDSDNSSLGLDSDSSKQHDGLESDDDEVSDDETAKSIDNKNISGLSTDLNLSPDASESTEIEESIEKSSRKNKGNGVKLSNMTTKKRTKKAVKKDVSHSSDDSSIDNFSSSKTSSDEDSDSDIGIRRNQVHESDNNIAKNQLLQLLQEDNIDGVDSDVEDLLSESNKENKNGYKSSASASKNKAYGKRSFKKHPLLTKQWDKSPTNSKQSTTKHVPSDTNKQPTAKRKMSKDNDENASKKRKETSINFDNENSESDLSTDSEADVWVGKPRTGVKRSRRTIFDSDSDEMPHTNVKDESDNPPSDDSDDFALNLPSKRRRTVKAMPTLDSDNTETPSKKGRKNIRKVLDDDEISQSTQEAKTEEMQRRKRIEAQRDSDEADVIVIDDENGNDVKINAAVKILNLTRLLLSKNPVVEVHPEIVQHLKPHQREGVQFIWENLIETVRFANSKHGNGCILSHCMGLGKTLQTIAFLHTVLLSEHLPKIRTALVVCPFITVNNWMAEFKQWIPKQEKLLFCSLDPAKTDEDRMNRLNIWRTNGGVMIVGYSLFRSLLKSKERVSSSWESILLEPDIFVCDEGHILKNAATALAQFANSVKTKRRLILTGTPLQNNMIEYHCMVSLVKPRLLGSIKEFKNRFVNPIENGQHVDSTDRDVRLMKKRAHVLHELLAGCVQRKDYTFLKEHLPPKYEYTLKVRLSKLQIRLYEKYLSLKGTGNLKSRKASLFRDFNKFLLIVCHPRCLVMQKETHKKKTPECDDDNEDEEEEEDGTSSDESVIILSDDEQESPAVSSVPKPTSVEDIHTLSKGKLRLFIRSKSGKNPTAKSRRKLVSMATRYLDENFCKTKEFEESIKSKPVSELKALIKEHGGNIVGCSEKSDLVNLLKSLLLKEVTSEEEWFDKLIPSQEKLYFANEHGGKMVLMLQILRGAAKLGDKVVIFSQSLICLDVIELILRAESKDTGTKSAAPFMKWLRNKDYFRIDGSIPGNVRTSLISKFNDTNNHRGRLLLVSTRAGSMGVNLVGANRAIIFDASWNPSHDTQSIFRIYRFGQTKTCYIYRLVAQGTMEEKVYERQVVKRSLSYRVVDEQQIPRHFTAADVSELYSFLPDMTKRKDSLPECAPPRDALLASILNSTDLIVSFHEPDSLLDHQVTEELSEAERKAAWEEYNTDNPKISKTSASITARLQVISRNMLMSLCKYGGNMLQTIDHKLLNIPDKNFDEMITDSRVKNRGISAEQANLDVVMQKLNNHILKRRLNNLKKTVTWYQNTAQKVYQARFVAIGSNRAAGGAPSTSSHGVSGSTMHWTPTGVDQRNIRPSNSGFVRNNNQSRGAPHSRPFIRVPNLAPQRPGMQFRFPCYQRPRPTYRYRHGK